MPYPVYKVIHLFGILLLVTGLAGGALYAMTIAAPARERAVRRLLGMMHGMGAFLVLFGGFGLLARIGIMQGGAWPGWVWAKLVIWVALGGILFLINRKPALARPVFLALPVLGGLAAFLAVYKPF